MNFGIDFVLSLIQRKTNNMVNGIPGVNLMTAFYSMINLWSGVLAAFFGVNAVKSDYDYGIVDQIWSFPIKKIDYLIMRILSNWLIVISYFLISLILGLIIFKLGDKEANITINILGSLAIDSLFILSMITFASLFSLIMPKTISFISTFFIYILISVSNHRFIDIPFSDSFNDLSFFKAIGLIFHYIFPRIGSLSIMSRNILSGTKLNSMGLEFLHFSVTYFLLFFLVYKIMKKKGPA